ncbi:hypothetical protein [Deinococcus daejeonensis]|uniref:Uncharacterized protein n=1 Tax=Deinococcus daejeonensis TaxID=1007098 RepID=A0ABQ2J009_9DEIO|nr:hypothetical protein [Deinococcus daejeonensis]GGN32326.1 hypothetical protein GCM10010842_08920 [Deinococcus daejeonensis]
MNRLDELVKSFAVTADMNRHLVRRFQFFVMELSRELSRQEMEGGSKMDTRVEWETRKVPVTEAQDGEPAKMADWGWVITVHLKSSTLKTYMKIEAEPAEAGGYDLINADWHEDNARVLDGTEAANVILDWELGRHQRLQKELDTGNLARVRPGDEFLN